MKPCRWKMAVSLLAVTLCGALATRAQTTRTWTGLTTGEWTDTDKWTPSGGYPDGVGDVARYTSSVSGTASTTNNADVTVGRILLDPLINTINTPSWTIMKPTPARRLTMDVASGSADIAIGRCSGTLTLNPEVVLNDPLTLRTFGVNNGKLVINGAFSGTGNLVVTNEATGGSAGITLAGAVNMAGTLTVNGSRTTTISGAIGANVTGITQNGSGQLMFGNIIVSTPSFLAINGGTVSFNNANGRIRSLPVTVAAGATLYGGDGLSIVFDDSTVDLDAGGSFAVQVNAGTTTSIRNLTGASTGILTFGRRVDSQNVLSVTQTVDGEFAGTLRNNLTNAGRAALTKNGAATLSLSGSNTHGGTTTVNAGTLRLGHNNALGYGGYYAAPNGVQGTIVYSAGTVDLNGRTVNEPFTLAGGALVNASLSQAARIDNGVAGISVSAEPGAGATVVISGGGGSGATATTAYPSGGAGTRGVRMTNPGGGYTSAPTVTISSGGGTPTATLSGIRLTGTASQMGGADDLAVNGVVGETASGAGFTKTGPGTLWLNGVNTYTGPTAVSQGALGGTGTIAGNVTVASDAAIASDLSSGGGLTVAGTVDLTAGNVTLALSGTTTEEEVTVLTAGTLSGAFAAVTGIPPGYTVRYPTPNRVVLAKQTGTIILVW